MLVPNTIALGETDSFNIFSIIEKAKSAISLHLSEAKPPLADAGSIENIYTVKFVDYDDTILKQQVLESGMAATPPETPSREGYEFVEWDTDFSSVTEHLTVKAVYKELETYTITINYLYEDDEITAPPYIATLPAGGSIDTKVQSPTVEGYTPDLAEISLNFESLTENKVFNVIYISSESVAYTVEHRLQNIAGNGYTVMDTDNKTGKPGDKAIVSLRSYEGFTTPATAPTAQIAADGSSVVVVNYERNFYTVLFNSHGTQIDPLVLMYGEEITKPENPSRDGYTFTVWNDKAGNEFDFGHTTMPAKNITLDAQWEGKDVEYTLVYWLENAENTNYSYFSQKKEQGIAGTTYEFEDSYTIFELTPAAISNAFTLDVDKTKLSDLTIKGDESTFVNLYFKRNTFKIDFYEYSVLTSPTPTIPPKIVKTMTGKYEQNILQEFSEYNDISKRSRWSTDVQGTGPWTTTLQLMPNKNIRFYPYVSGGIFYEFHYLLQNLDSTTYTLRHDTPIKVSEPSGRLVVTKEDTYPIEGFTYEIMDGQPLTKVTLSPAALSYERPSFSSGTITVSGSSITLGAVQAHPRVAELYYTRNSYNIDFKLNGGGGTAPASISKKYEAPLLDTASNEEPPGLGNMKAPNGKEFAGWYTTETCTPGTEFTFEGNMPASNIILYAKWAPISHIVTVVFDNGTKDEEITVLHGEKVVLPENPTKSGYTFEYWGKDNRPFSPDTSVVSDITIKAVWTTDNTLICDVKFLDMEDTDLVPKKQILGNKVDTSVWAQAERITGYLPDKASKSKLMSATGENVIIFRYKPFDDTTYTANYVDALDKKPLAESKTVKTGASIITENFKVVDGYTPDKPQKTLVLSQTTADNVITFEYKARATTTPVDYVFNNYTINTYHNGVLQTTAAGIGTEGTYTEVRRKVIDNSTGGKDTTIYWLLNIYTTSGGKDPKPEEKPPVEPPEEKPPVETPEEKPGEVPEETPGETPDDNNPTDPTNPARPPQPDNDRGQNLVPNDNGSFTLIGDDGVPLGTWNWDDEEEIWIFDEAVPLANFNLPKTGDETAIYLYSLLMLLSATAFGGIVWRRKVKKVKEK